MGEPGAPRPRSESAGIVSPAGNPKSGEILVQCTPPSVVAMRNWNAAINSCGFHGANANGCEMVVRPYKLGFKGSGIVVPHSQPDTGFQSSGVMAPRLPRLRVRMAPASCCEP